MVSISSGKGSARTLDRRTSRASRMKRAIDGSTTHLFEILFLDFGCKVPCLSRRQAVRFHRACQDTCREDPVMVRSKCLDFHGEDFRVFLVPLPESHQGAVRLDAGARLAGSLRLTTRRRGVRPGGAVAASSTRVERRAARLPSEGRSAPASRPASPSPWPRPTAPAVNCTSYTPRRAPRRSVPVAWGQEPRPCAARPGWSRRNGTLTVSEAIKRNGNQKI